MPEERIVGRSDPDNKAVRETRKGQRNREEGVKGLVFPSLSSKSLTVYIYLPRDKRADPVLSQALAYSGTISKKHVITRV